MVRYNCCDNKKTTDKMLFLLMISCIFLQRIVLPIRGNEIPVIFILGYICIFVLIFKNILKVDLLSLILYILFLLVICFTLFFQSNISFFSLIYLVLLYIPFVFLGDFDKEKKILFLKKLQNIILIVSIIGLLQFLIQLIGGEFIDPISYIPEKFLRSNYNTTYSLAYGIKFMKPNGCFFLEPSFFSQYIAIGIIVELIYFRRFKRIIIMLIALLSTFSGTGIMLLLLCIVPIFFKLKFKNKIILLGILSVIVVLFMNSSFSEFTVSRIKEFTYTDSSASIRFVNPYKNILAEKDSAFFIGNGPGSVENRNFTLKSNFSVIPKLWYEYGFIQMSIFIIFLIYSIFKRNRNFLMLAVFIMYLILSGSLLQPEIVFFVYLIRFISDVNQ